MINVDTSLAPPGLDIAGKDDDRPTLFVTAWLTEADGTRRNASVLLDGDASNVELADALVSCLRGCAASHGPGLVAAVEGRLR